VLSILLFPLISSLEFMSAGITQSTFSASLVLAVFNWRGLAWRVPAVIANAVPKLHAGPARSAFYTMGLRAGSGMEYQGILAACARSCIESAMHYRSFRSLVYKQLIDRGV